MSKKSKWLPRDVAPAGPHLALALSQKDFDKAQKVTGYPEHVPWLSDGEHGRTTFLRGPNTEVMDTSAVVSVAPNLELAQAVGVISHEAAHIWQFYEGKILGENERSGTEQEAYAVGFITETLVREYLRRAKKKGKK